MIYPNHMKMRPTYMKKKKKTLYLESEMNSGGKEPVIFTQNPLWPHHIVSPCCQLGLYSLQMLRLLLSHFLKHSPLPFSRGWASYPSKICCKASLTDVPRAEHTRRQWNWPAYSSPAEPRAFHVGNHDSDHTKGQNRWSSLGKQDMLPLVTSGWPPEGKSQSSQRLWPMKFSIGDHWCSEDSLALGRSEAMTQQHF